jgi:hypothetical protein
MTMRSKRMKPPRDAWEESARIVEGFAAGGGELMVQFLAEVAEAIRKRGAQIRKRVDLLPHHLSVQSDISDPDQGLNAGSPAAAPPSASPPQSRAPRRAIGGPAGTK